MCVEAGVHVDTKQLLSNFEAEIAWILKQPEAEPKNGVAYKKNVYFFNKTFLFYATSRIDRLPI